MGESKQNCFFYLVPVEHCKIIILEPGSGSKLHVLLDFFFILKSF